MNSNEKMRLALEKARDLLLPQCNGGTAFAKACGEVVNEIMNALGTPPRNCDVGTDKEQSKRFKKYCAIQKSFEWGCEKCPVFPYEIIKCEFIWSQLPYQEKGVMK